MGGMCLMGAVAVVITLCFLNYEAKERTVPDKRDARYGKNEEKGIWKYIERRALPAAWIYLLWPGQCCGA